MDAGDVETACCAVCGRAYPLNRHHMVPRSAGKLYRDGVEIAKPTIVLCGNGNNLRDAWGRPLCHGLAHHHMLHFRCRDEKVEYLFTDSPVDYLTALGLDGWRVQQMDANYAYAQDADRYYERQDRTSLPSEACCGNCEHIDPCPPKEAEVGRCKLDGEWAVFEKDPCNRWELAEGVVI